MGRCQQIVSAAQQGRAVFMLGWKRLKNSCVDFALDWCCKKQHQVETNKASRN